MPAGPVRSPGGGVGGHDDRLSPDELDAVLAHEQAHLRARHDLVLESFQMLRTAYPGWVRGELALTRAGTLVGTPAPDTGIAAARCAVVLRVRRLSEPIRPHRLLAAITYAAAAALLVTPTLTVAVPVLRALATLP